MRRSGGGGSGGGAGFAGRFLVVAALGLAAGCAGCASGSRSIEALPAHDARVAMLPFAYLAAPDSATALVEGAVLERARERFATVLSPTDIREVLREHRIRGRRGLTAEEGRILREETSARYALIGAVSLYAGAPRPEVAVSVRILDLQRMEIVAASTAGVAVEDRAGAFGAGGVDSAAALVADAADEVFRRMDLSALGAEDVAEDAPAAGGTVAPGEVGSTDRAAASEPGSPRIALVPFDALDDATAGAIVTDILLARLFEAGFVVAEPGIVDGIFRQSGSVSRGEIDYRLMDAVEAGWGADWIVTGVVQKLEPARGPESPAVFEYGARILDARTHRILGAVDETRSGEDSAVFFSFGRIHSIDRLVHESFEPLIRKLHALSR